MKVLYVGELDYGATSRMRMEHLRGLGHQVAAIDTKDDSSAGALRKTAARVSFRLGWPIDLKNVNAQLEELARRYKPDLVWVDKGVCLRRATLESIRHTLPCSRLVHYNPDDPFGLGGKRGWRTFIASIPSYDIHFVPRKENVSEYLSRGAQRVVHSVPTRGFDPDVHRPYGESNELKASFAADVGFLGAFEMQRALMLRQLAERGVAIRLMADWPRSFWHANFLRAPYSVRGNEYAKAIGSFKIALGFLRKVNRDRHTSRSIEIPACGTFLLAERTDEHLALFEEGKEAEFFDSTDEMIDKTRFYLANESAREAIARAGRERCLRSGYDYASRMRAMLAEALSAQEA